MCVGACEYMSCGTGKTVVITVAKVNNTYILACHCEFKENLCYISSIVV